MPTQRHFVFALLGAALAGFALGPATLADERLAGQYPLYFLKVVDITVSSSGDEAFRECGLDRKALIQGAAGPIAGTAVKVSADGAEATYRIRLVLENDAQTCTGYVGSEVGLQMPLDPPFRGQAITVYSPFVDVILWRMEGLVRRPTADFADAVKDLLEAQAEKFVSAWKEAHDL